MSTLNLGTGGASIGGSGANLTSTSAMDLTGNIVDFPAGTVIQTVYAESTAEVSTSSSSYQNFFGCTWTPKQSNSHTIIMVNAIRLIVGAADLEANFRISDGSNVTYRYRIYNDGVSDNLWLNPCLSWYWTQGHTAGQSCTFTAQCRDGAGSGSNVIWGDSGSTSTMVIQEIAQ